MFYIKEILLFLIGLFSTPFVLSNTIIPLIYGLPKSLFLIYKKELKIKAVLPFIIAPIFWWVLYSFILYIFPHLLNSKGFILGYTIGFLFFIIKLFSKETWKDISIDFERLTKIYRTKTTNEENTNTPNNFKENISASQNNIEADHKFYQNNLSSEISEDEKVLRSILTFLVILITIFGVGIVFNYLFSPSLNNENNQEINYILSTTTIDENIKVENNEQAVNNKNIPLNKINQESLSQPVCEPGAILCNNKCWTPCPKGQRFVCPSKGDAYCESENITFNQNNQIISQQQSEWLNLQDFIDKVALIKCPLDENFEYWSIGSGFLINTQGNVLTNYHIVKGAYKNFCFVSFTNNFNLPPSKSYIAYITTAYDEELDYALLYIYKQIDSKTGEFKEITNRKFPFISSCNSDIVKLGDPVIIIGFPSYGGETITATEGIISGSLGDYFKTSAKIDKGNSGAPVFLDDSRYNCFIGIATFLIKGSGDALGYILKSNSIMDSLKTIQ